MNLDTKITYDNVPYNNIPFQLQMIVWKNYFGIDKTFGKCTNCTNYITINSFNCIFYISPKDGGMMQPGNLKPVCEQCYSTLKTKSIFELQSNQSQKLVNFRSQQLTQPSKNDDLMDTSD